MGLATGGGVPLSSPDPRQLRGTQFQRTRLAGRPERTAAAAPALPVVSAPKADVGGQEEIETSDAKTGVPFE